MKKILLSFLVLFLLSAIPSFAQVKVTVNLSSRPDPYLSNWAKRKEVVIVTIINSGTSTVRAKFDCKVNQNGGLVANTKPEKMRILDIPTGVSQYYGEELVPFENVKIKDGLDRTAVQTGMLPAGMYEFCCSLLDQNNIQISPPVCKNFTIQSYQPPSLLQPEDKGQTAVNSRPMFRWTPVSPKPPFPISYKLQVFEVLSGQTAINAFRVNRPILERTGITVTQFQWSADYDLPKERMQYIWTVQSLDDNNAPIGENNGYATPFTFTNCPDCKVSDVVDNGSNAKEKGKDSTKKDRDFKPMGEHIPDVQFRTKSPPDSLIDDNSGSSNDDLSANKESKDSTKKTNGPKISMGEHIPEAKLRTKSTEEDTTQINEESNNSNVSDKHIKDWHDKKKNQLRYSNSVDSSSITNDDSTNHKSGGQHIADAFGRKKSKKGEAANDTTLTNEESNNPKSGGQHIAESGSRWIKKAKKSFDEYSALSKKGYDYYATQSKKGYDYYAAQSQKGYDPNSASAKKSFDEYSANAKKSFDEYSALLKKSFDEYSALSKKSFDEYSTLTKEGYDAYSAEAKKRFDEYSVQLKKGYDYYAAQSKRGYDYYIMQSK